MSTFNPSDLGISLVKEYSRKPAKQARISVTKNGHSKSGNQLYSLYTNIGGEISRRSFSNPNTVARVYHKTVATVMGKGFSAE